MEMLKKELEEQSMWGGCLSDTGHLEIAAGMIGTDPPARVSHSHPFEGGLGYELKIYSDGYFDRIFVGFFCFDSTQVSKNFVCISITLHSVA